MGQSQKVFKVFVASPGDLIEERAAAEDIVKEANLLLAEAVGARFELVRWEKNARPGIGADAQDVVNRQMGDNCDVFVGLMWGRFGTPTNRAESGTEEEFNLALARWKRDPNSVEIMFYFKDAPLPPSQIDPHQLIKIQDFKTRFAHEYGGLAWPLDDVEDFKSQLRMHLSASLRAWSEKPDEPSTELASPPISDAVLKHFLALTDEDFDEGFIELSEQANSALAALVPIMERVSNATSALGENMRSRTAELEGSKVPGQSLNRDDAKRIANFTADDIEKFVRELAAIIPEYQRKQTEAFDLFGKVVVLANADFQEPVEDVRQVLGSVQTLKIGMLNSVSQMTAFRDNMAGLPRMTTAFNRARQRAVALLDDLMSETEAGFAQAADIERLLMLRIEKLGAKN